MRENYMQSKKRGDQILNVPLLNKGTAFNQEERDRFGLNGLLPPEISSVEIQIKRNYYNFSQKRTPLEKYEALMGLMSRNEILFYQLIARYPEEVLPIIYTPTVGDAAIQYSRIYFHQRGLYLSYPLRNRLEEAISNHPVDEVDVVVVTDGERILGLGDLGIGGMTIPIGKLSLYTLFAGIHPARTLPIILDVGTNNAELLNDELYLGWRKKRIRGAEYDAFVDEFVRALKKRYPKILLQWEDFGKDNARRLLDHYRDKILSFNDDIQGTASVALAGLLVASQVAGRKFKDERVVIVGAGSAGTGIADTVVAAMVDEGLDLKEARERIYLIDVNGLIYFGTNNMTEAQKPYAQPQSKIKDWKTQAGSISLLDVISNAKPTVLVGVCAQGGAFTQKVVEEMYRHVKKPIIFPLSNPTIKAECTPEEALKWTEGNAIIATGSPFDPVTYNGKTHHITQCNNVYIFPGMGLGVLAAKASKVTDGMFLSAARTLAKNGPALKDSCASLFPSIPDAREIAKKIALAVAKKACEEGVASCPVQDLEKEIAARVWDPRYPQLN